MKQHCIDCIDGELKSVNRTEDELLDVLESLANKHKNELLRMIQDGSFVPSERVKSLLGIR